MIEIHVPRGDEGAFNAPHDCPDVGAYAEAIRDRVGRYYGTAMRHFLQRLVEHRSANDTELIDGINRRIADFAALPSVRGAGVVSSRIIGAFGLGYAAGCLAQHYGILPRTMSCEAAALHCLRLHLGLRAEANPAQRLLAWISANEVTDLRGGNVPMLSDTKLRRRGAFIGECRGVTQFWMSPSLFGSSFDDARTFLRSLAAKQMLKREGKGRDAHLAIKQTVRTNKPTDRVHVFTIPDLENWLEANGYPRPKPRRR